MIGRRTENGSASLEVAILAPAFVLLILLATGVGRIADVHMTLDDAAQQAARAASLAFDARSAEHDARSTVDAALTSKMWACPDLNVVVDASTFGPGGRVAVDISCTVRLAEFSLLGMDGKHLHARSVEVVDAYRSVP